MSRPLATYSYDESALEPDEAHVIDHSQQYTMEARHYASAGSCEVVVREFNKDDQVVTLREYHERIAASCRGADGRFVGNAIQLPPSGGVKWPKTRSSHQECDLGGCRASCVSPRAWRRRGQRGNMAEYTRYDCDFNTVERFIGIPDLAADPPASQKTLRVTSEHARKNPGQEDDAWGVSQITSTTRHIGHNELSQLIVGHCGVLLRRRGVSDSPRGSVGDRGSWFLPLRLHRPSTTMVTGVSTAKRGVTGAGATVLTSYAYDAHGNLTLREQREGTCANPGSGDCGALAVCLRRVRP